MLTERKGEAVLKGDVEALSTPGADVEIISSMIDHIMTLAHLATQEAGNGDDFGQHIRQIFWHSIS